MVFRDKEPGRKGSADYIRERKADRQQVAMALFDTQALGLRMVHIGVAVLEMVYDNLDVIDRETFHEYVNEAYDLFSAEEEDDDSSS